MNIQFDLGDIEYVFAIQTREKGLETYSISYGESTSLVEYKQEGETTKKVCYPLSLDLYKRWRGKKTFIALKP